MFVKLENVLKYKVLKNLVLVIICSYVFDRYFISVKNENNFKVNSCFVYNDCIIIKG